MKRRAHPLWIAAALVAVASAGCGGDAPAAPAPRPLDGNDAGVCDDEVVEGCPCAPGTEPEACFTENGVVGSIAYCHSGTRYCRDGRWSACADLRAFQVRLDNKLISAPTTCSACDPACSSGSAFPDDSDLTPQNSSDVVYDPGAGGLVITSSTVGGGGSQTDTDMDGVPDVADQCPGQQGWRTPCDNNATNDGFYHTLPFGSAPVTDELEIDFQLQTADVYVLMDNTGSMADEITNLRNTLRTGTIDGSCAEGVNGGVLGAIRCAIPDTAFGLGLFREYGTGGSGEAGHEYNLYYHHALDITTDLALMQTNVGRLYTQGNVTTEESITQALYSTITGRGLGRYLGNRTACANGGFGYACFRPSSIPIVILLTDAMFANGPVTTWDYVASTDVQWPSAVVSPVRTGDTSSADTQATAYDVGDVRNGFFSVLGTTTGMGSHYSSTCGGVSTADAVFQFTVSAGGGNRTIAIDTRGSAYNTVLELRNGSFNNITCNDDVSDMGYTSQSRIERTLSPGTYYVVVDGQGASGNYRLNFRDLGSFANRGAETQATAVSLGSLGTSSLQAVGTTTGMANDYNTSCGSSGVPDAVFSFTLATSKPVEIHTVGSNFDTVLSLRNSAFTEITCNADSPFGAIENDLARISTTLAAGTYYVVLDGQSDEVENGSQGEYVLNIENGVATAAVPIPGDTQASAINLGTLGTGSTVSTTGNTALLKGDYTLSCGASTGSSPDAVYSFTLSSATRLFIDTSSSFFDTAISLRNSTFTQVSSGCDPDAGNGDTSRLNFSSGTGLAAGTYYVIVDGENGDAGAFNLMIRTYGPAGTAPATTFVEAADTYTTFFDLGTLTAGTVRAVEGDNSSLANNVNRCTNNNNAGRDAVFRFTTAVAGNYTFTTDGSTFDTVLSVRGSASPYNVVSGGCNDDDTSLANTAASTVTVALAANTTYFVVVDGYANNSTGRYRLRIVPPNATQTRDLMVGQTSRDAIYDLGDVTFVTRTATYLNDDLGSYFRLSCMSSNTERDYPTSLFRFTLSQPTRVSLNTVGLSGGNDSGIAVFASNLATQLGCADTNYSTAAYLDADLPAGTYYAVVQTDAGPVQLNVVGSPPASNAAAVPNATESSAVTWSEVSTEVGLANAKYITVSSCNSGESGYVCPDVATAAQSLGTISGSVDDGGNAFYYTINSNGSGLGSTIVTAVQTLAQYARLDVDVQCFDITPGNGIAECDLVAGIAPTSCPSSRCQSQSGSQCIQCLPGTDLEYNVTIQNDVFPATAVDQIFEFEIRAIADGTSVVSTTPVRILVPANVTMTEYADTGTFQQDYDATLRCAYPARRADWGTLTYSTNIPAGTSITFNVYAADSQAALSSVTPYAFTAQSGPSQVIDLGPGLIGAGFDNDEPFLRVQAVLRSNPANTVSPTLMGWGIDFRCRDFE